MPVGSRFKCLIVGVDFSDYSKLVVREARLLAEILTVPLTFVYVYEGVEVIESSLQTSRRELARSCAADVKKNYKIGGSGETVVVRFGAPYEQLIAAAKRAKNSLIIVGHRGQNFFSRMFLGSTAERLALFSPVPVWIHRGQTVKIPKSIFIPCDLSDRSERTIAQMSPFRRTFRASAELYHVQQIPMPIPDYNHYSSLYAAMEERDKAAMRKFKKRHPQIKSEKTMGSVAQALGDRAREFDLIAISPRSHRKKVPMFGSVTTKLIRSIERPILVIP